MGIESHVQDRDPCGDPVGILFIGKDILFIYFVDIGTGLKIGIGLDIFRGTGIIIYEKRIDVEPGQFGPSITIFPVVI